MTRRIFSAAGLFLLAVITGIFIVVLGSRGSLAQTDCRNFWINPQTGAEECLDRLSRPVPAAPGSTSSGSESSSPVSKEVLAQLQTKGSTRVIVILKSDPVAKQRLEDQLDNVSARGTAEASIAALVNPVANSLNLNAANSGLIKFTTVPAFAAELNRDQIDRLSNDSRVQSIEVDREMVKHLDQTLPLIQMGAARQAGANGVNTSIVVIDDGIQRDHPFIGVSRIAREACFLDFNGCPNGTSEQVGSGAAAAASGASHGTHVAGIALGNRGSDGVPRRGVAPQARVIPINIFGSSSNTAFSTIQRAFEHADSLSLNSPELRIAAINMSVGGGGSTEACDADPTMALLRPVIQRLRLRGVPSVVSAGNDSRRNAMGFPACLGDIVSVAATSRTGVVSSYTDISNSTDLFAPGGDSNTGCVLSSVQPSAYSQFCGTSMAAPHVAGAIAALKSRVPTATAAQLVQALRATGVATADSRSGGIHQKPRINVNNALNRLLGTAQPPGNNNIANARLVNPTGLFRSNGTNVGATRETNEPNHGVSNSIGSVWWQYRPTNNGNMRISTLGSDFDTVLAVYRGNPMINSSQPVAANDNALGTVRYSEVSFAVEAGRTYNIAVAGARVGERGQAQLTFIAPPPNDNFVNAQTVNTSSTVTGANVGATFEAGEPVHLYSAATTSIWYQFTAPSSGNITLNTIGSNFDTILGVYQGSQVNALTQRAINDDIGSSNLQSQVTLPVTAGQVYRVVVTGFGGASGSVQLALGGVQ